MIGATVCATCRGVDDGFCPTCNPPVHVVPEGDVIEHDALTTCTCVPVARPREPGQVRELYVHKRLSEEAN